MCNLHLITTNQVAIAALFRVINHYVGNLPPMPGVFPDYPAPVVRNVGIDRELVMMRWGMPPPPKLGGAPVTNIRNTTSPHWRGWLKLENRCLVPVNSFAEYAPEPNPETKKKDVVWFALNDDRPIALDAQKVRKHLALALLSLFVRQSGSVIPLGVYLAVKRGDQRILVQPCDQ